MTYSLSPWTHPTTGEQRLYVNGTTRKAVYLAAAKSDGRLIWSSKVQDTPTKFRSGDHWGKVNKDRDAAYAVAEALGLRLGEQDWALAVQTAATGLQVKA